MDGVRVGKALARWLQVYGRTRGQATERTRNAATFVYALEQGHVQHIDPAGVLNLFALLGGGAEARGFGIAAGDFSEEEIYRLIEQDPKLPDFIDP